jgi:D-alanine-D-alanine ligase
MAERKVRVAVVMGGISSEHTVSLESGRNVCNGLLLTKRYLVKPVVITLENGWRVFPDWIESDFSGMPTEVEEIDAGRALAGLISAGVEVVFIAMHGPGGEDGVIQGFFQTAGIPYTGSGVLGNAVGMDKVITKSVLMHVGIPTAPFMTVDSAEVLRDVDKLVSSAGKVLGFPCVAKVSNEGSSHNMGIASDAGELRGLLKRIATPGKLILIEQFIRGRELTCAVIERVGWDKPRALPPTELVPKTSKFFDYEAKYTPGATDEITPARISGETTARVQEIALRCHSELRCGGMSRTDMIMQEDGELFVLEINTIPGLTGTSLIPQAAAVAGISFSELLEIQVEWALSQKNRR